MLELLGVSEGVFSSEDIEEESPLREQVLARLPNLRNLWDEDD
jgi:hypothetical protein